MKGKNSHPSKPSSRSRVRGGGAEVLHYPKYSQFRPFFSPVHHHIFATKQNKKTRNATCSRATKSSFRTLRTRPLWVFSKSNIRSQCSYLCSNFFIPNNIINNNYRPRNEGYIFTGVCHSVTEQGGGVTM